MAWVQGICGVRIHEDGHIECTTSALTVIAGKRPASIAESGADPAVFEAIRKRAPGQYETKGFMGGATAIVVPFRSLTWLDEPLMERLRVKYGFTKWPDEVCVMLVRNTAAPAIQNAAEPAGGMAEDTNLLVEQLKEIVEVGVYREDGWAGFVLPKMLEDHWELFGAEQYDAWDIVRAGFPHRYDVGIEPLTIGRDLLDERRGIITAGPVGDFSFLSIARLHLDDTGWRLLDTEAWPGDPFRHEPEWVALRRTVMVVVPRAGKSPIGFHFGDDGALHPCSIHVPLSGEAWDLNLTHLGRAAIEALGWNNS